MRIAIFALDGFFDTGLSVQLDAFALANRLSKKELDGGPSFEVSLVGVRKKVTSARGMPIVAEVPGADFKPDWVVMLALSRSTPELLVPALASPDVKKATKLLAKWCAEGTQVAASCVGTFLLAEAGLLDGRPATTTWWLAPLFRQRYPKVLLDEARMLVPSDIGVTAGAALGHLDLALWLIRRVSPDLAEMVSRYLMADIRSQQAPYIIPNHLAQSDPVILRFERWAKEHLKEGFSLQAAAADLAISSRSLQRRCQAVLGKSPLAYFQDLRVERARSLIHGSGLGLEAIAAEVGYEDGDTLRTLLRQRLGKGVRELRNDLR